MTATPSRPSSVPEIVLGDAASRPLASPRFEPIRQPMTARSIARLVEKGEPFACLTCYDATTARWLQQAGIPVLLVGDTAAEMILGLPSTIHAPLDFLILITAAVKRGAPNCLVMADMPFMSYQTSDADGLRNAGRFMTEGLADAVKLEVDRSFTGLVSKMAHAGVPVVAHLGLRPQHVRREGGYRFAGRTASEARELIDAARAMEDAGSSMLLLEAMPAEVSEAIVSAVKIPVIGCGAGPACHGQIVVLQDLLGLTPRQPPFAPPLTDGGGHLMDAAAKWADRVKRRDLGEHPYRMDAGEMNGLKGVSEG
ncbi:MAG: 3-methyl-2-oxobutanoate hydroxymethyltransferase [Phycisphaeraceae bacterium]|nr:MAG: 3-methyl-2-oxobutanoate hydroxymethyltransferase [Phycisphaeraceae bacterium]